MASKDSFSYFSNFREMSQVRAVAETLMNSSKVRKITAKEAYEMSKKQPGISETDLLIYPAYAKEIGLPEGSKVLNDCHGNIVGRTAKARRFYNRLEPKDKDKVDGDLREAVFQMEQYPLVKAEAVLGMDKDLMIKATFVTTESDVFNVFNWLCNFRPYETVEKEYLKSAEVPILDIILVAFNEWTCDDPFYNNVGAPQLALVDEIQNVVFCLGMRYFGERKKNTLTMGWTSGIKLGLAACHGGIKEIDFSTCDDKSYHSLGKRSIAFFGLSGTGKSSHTNSHTNGGSLPKGFSKVVLHDDAFQIDVENNICRGWEPTFFDKTDSREPFNKDWDYTISLMNHTVMDFGGKRLPVGFDIRNANGRALISRDVIGKSVNRCSFPKAVTWLMKDSVLPPIIKFTDKNLAVAMGATLMTERNKAENISAEELNQLVFEPFANPFRIYELFKDVEAFLKIADNQADFYSFNSKGYWKSSDANVSKIPLATSLKIQTAILTDALEWEPWEFITGTFIPTAESIHKIIPDYYQNYDHRKIENFEEYKALLYDRIHLRIFFLKQSDVATKPELLNKLINSFNINI